MLRPVVEPEAVVRLPPSRRGGDHHQHSAGHQDQRGQENVQSHEEYPVKGRNEEEEKRQNRQDEPQDEESHPYQKDEQAREEAANFDLDRQRAVIPSPTLSSCVPPSSSPRPLR